MNLINYTTKPNKLYIYTRVSTKSQAFVTNGLCKQNNICLEYIENNFKGHLCENHEEIGSSYNNKSKLPILNKLMRKIEPNSVLVVSDISRLGRNTFQVFSILKKIKKNNSYIISVSDNLCYNYSKLMDREFSYKIIDSEKNSDIKSIAVTNRINNIKNSGGYLGKAPYGTIKIKYNNIPYLYKNPLEINIINLMKKIYKTNKSVKKVVSCLNLNKIFNRKDRLWTEYSVKNILKKNFPNILLNPNSNVVSNIYSNLPCLSQKNWNKLKKIEINEKLLCGNENKIIG